MHCRNHLVQAFVTDLSGVSILIKIYPWECDIQVIVIVVWLIADAHSSVRA